MSRIKPWYGFHVNEYNYKTIQFSRNFSQERAEKFASRLSRRFRNYESSVSDDVTPMVIHGRDELIKWAAESFYTIDWKNKLMTYVGEE